MTIGAAGLETGLLNILYGGSSGKAYGEFNDSQVLMTQYIMKQAGIAQTSKDVVGFRDALWEKGNGGQELNMLDVMIRNGNSISNQVFTQYYDTAVNIQIANDKGKDIGNFPHAQIIPSLFPRYLDLYNTKKEFFDNIKDVLNGDLNYYISGEFGDQYNGHYAYYNYKHYGIDLSREGGPSNDPIYTGIAGKITDKNWSYAANGNSTQIEYGYTFEGSFSSTGLYGEYLHMKDETIYPVGTILESTIQIGQVAGTPNYDPHLHYDILSKKSYSESTLALLLGKDALQSSFSSIDNKKTVYDPALFYKNWLNKSLLVKK
jgi:murein DD-endopeptidase MepM/ murein hydrolase activator NlpD